MDATACLLRASILCFICVICILVVRLTPAWKAIEAWHSQQPTVEERSQPSNLAEFFPSTRPLVENKFFSPAWDGPAPVARGVVTPEDCQHFQGDAEFNCAIEGPEHTLVRKWLPPDATVMEFGARFGTTSCEIAVKQNNSGRFVVVEPDRNVWNWLNGNLERNGCHAHVLRGLIGSQPLQQSGSGYGAQDDPDRGRTVPITEYKDGQPVAAPGMAVVPNFHFDEVEAALGRTIDTLMIDCEGCVQHMMGEIGPKIENGQIKMILIEADAGADYPFNDPGCSDGCMEYRKFFSYLHKHGFGVIDVFNDCDRTKNGVDRRMPGTVVTGADGVKTAEQRCGSWIWHSAWKLGHSDHVSEDVRPIMGHMAGMTREDTEVFMPDGVMDDANTDELWMQHFAWFSR